MGSNTQVGYWPTERAILAGLSGSGLESVWRHPRGLGELAHDIAVFGQECISLEFAGSPVTPGSILRMQSGFAEYAYHIEWYIYLRMSQHQLRDLAVALGYLAGLEATGDLRAGLICLTQAMLTDDVMTAKSWGRNKTVHTMGQLVAMHPQIVVSRLIY
jgi:hypothetical protein